MTYIYVEAKLLGPSLVCLLVTAGREVSDQMVAAVRPLMSSIGDSVEAILLTIHKEGFGEEGGSGTKTDPAQPCSLYMKELQAFLDRISRDFLSTFTCHAFLSNQLQPLAESTIQRCRYCILHLVQIYSL